MSNVLNADQRRHLDAAIQRARRTSELAAANALHALAVGDPSRPGFLSELDNNLRLSLRDKARQLGDITAMSGAPLTNLVREVAYEQWHRLLFARFLEVNGLLRHPEFRDASLTLDDCSDLANDLGEPDGWAVAARFASEILPGVFRLDDPAVQVRFATEHRLELEQVLLSIAGEVFITEDALGWVYQFWQTAEKKRVNDSGVKIGGADLSPVTQLFTEDYMVHFLLENSLGAWWAARNPHSPLINDWAYLRRLEDGTPVAGTFDDWPASAADITVMDPCCGSGHFLVLTFQMLWRMRAESEGLTSFDAQDAVLRDNLFGLELDSRCTQIAMFAVALQAWKQSGFRSLPVPNVACSGGSSKSPLSEWTAIADGSPVVESALGRLHSLFSNADTLGSLIDVARATEEAGLESVEWGDVAPALQDALALGKHRPVDAPTAIVGAAVVDIARAADYLAREYTLVATNVPYLSRQKMSNELYRFVSQHHAQYSGDLAGAMLDRCRRLAGQSGTVAVVIPDKLLTAPIYTGLRRTLLRSDRWAGLALLGPRSFSTTMFDFGVALMTLDPGRPEPRTLFPIVDASKAPDFEAQRHELRDAQIHLTSTEEQLNRPDSRVGVGRREVGTTLAQFADAYYGLGTGDYGRYGRKFWELPALGDRWIFQQSTVSAHQNYGGREQILLWEQGRGALSKEPGAFIRNTQVWGSHGVMVSLTGSLWCSIYEGGAWDSNAAPIIPKDPSFLAAIWAFCTSGEFSTSVRSIDRSVKVMNNTLLKVPFDVTHWTSVAKLQFPEGLPDPSSDDVTQWLFAGEISGSLQPLQVAVARILGYRWPEQQADGLDRFADSDGIAALQSLPGQPDLVTRLRELLADEFGAQWSSTLERSLVTQAGGKNGRLEDWLRGTFFAQHVKIFDNRPFLWHIWDRRKDGYSAVVNYHRLDHRNLEKLTFTSLGAWIERQKHEADAGRAGADARLAAAEVLQARLKLILDGAPPYDAYVRWKELHEQPIGWNPDLDDGVRLNIRPFLTAEVLRSRVNVHWKKDRGTNSDGSERINDLHPTLEERRQARRLAGAEQ